MCASVYRHSPPQPTAVGIKNHNNTIRDRNSTIRPLIVQVHKEQITQKKTISPSNESKFVATVTKEEKRRGCGWKCVCVGWRGGGLSFGATFPHNTRAALCHPAIFCLWIQKAAFKQQIVKIFPGRESEAALGGQPPRVRKTKEQGKQEGINWRGTQKIQGKHGTVPAEAAFRSGNSWTSDSHSLPSSLYSFLVLFFNPLSLSRSLFLLFC